MRRIKLRKRRGIKCWNIFITALIFLLMMMMMLLMYFNNKVLPILFNFAELETIKLANLIINRAINKQVASEMNLDNLFTTVQDKEGVIQTIDFNPTIVNRVLGTTTNIVQLHLKAIEQGDIDLIEIPDNILVEYDKENLRKGIIYEVPLLAATRNAFLSNIGPKIPVKLNLVGSVISNIKTQIKQYGINNALVEVYIQIEVTEQVNLPFMSKRVPIKTDIPVALKVIQGQVPLYYQGNGLEKNSSILALPIE